MCTIHGPFGCGKSSLLVAVIHYLLKQRNQQGSALKGCRVMLSAHTNVAVDRLMTGLIETGCTGVLCFDVSAAIVRLKRRQLHTGCMQGMPSTPF